MDRELSALDGRQDDHLKKVAGERRDRQRVALACAGDLVDVEVLLNDPAWR